MTECSAGVALHSVMDSVSVIRIEPKRQTPNIESDTDSVTETERKEQNRFSVSVSVDAVMDSVFGWTTDRH